MCGRNRHREDHQDVVLGDFGDIEAQAGDQSQLDRIDSQSQFGFNTAMSMIRKHSLGIALFAGCLLLSGLVLACIYKVTGHSTPVLDSKPLTAQEEHVVAEALTGPDSEILVSIDRRQTNRRDMRRLKPAGWLNDNKDIFDLDLLLIPIHPRGNHWTLMSLNMKKKTAEYYDSLGWKNGKAVLTYLKAFLRVEWMNKRGGNGYDKMEQWDLKEYVPGKDMPKQENKSDCGVFVCKTAEYLLDGRELTFTQSDMETFRKRMVLDLLRKRIGD
eukprot:224645_1